MLVGAAPPPGRRAVVMAFAAEAARVGCGLFFLLQLVETLTNGWRIARQAPGAVRDPTMPQLGRLDGRLPTSILRRQPPEKSLPLAFDLCCIHVHTALLDARLTPYQGYCPSSNPGSYS
jgi:hypothetical protein